MAKNSFQFKKKIITEKAPPCHYCESRYVGCHAECLEYQNWNKIHQENKDLYFKEMELKNQAYRQKIEGIYRSRKRSHKE